MTQIALITGASRRLGLGYAVARELASRGFHAVLASRNLDQTAELAAELTADGLSAEAARLDVTEPADIAALLGRFDRLDVLINNAAAMPDFGATSLMEVNIHEARTAHEVDVLGPWALTQACLPVLKAAPAARVVNIVSGAVAQIANPTGPVFAPGYSMAKFTLNALTVALAAELKDAGILVNAVDPGEVASHPEAGHEGNARPAAEAALGVVWAATLPLGGPTGGQFFDGKPITA